MIVGTIFFPVVRTLESLGQEQMHSAFATLGKPHCFLVALPITHTKRAPIAILSGNPSSGQNVMRDLPRISLHTHFAAFLQSHTGGRVRFAFAARRPNAPRNSRTDSKI